MFIRSKKKFYEVMGVRVMLDFDIAKLFQDETKRIIEAVKNNLMWNVI